MLKDIGLRIKKLRKEKKYSQQFIAEKLNISQSAYSLIESAHNNVMIGHVLTLSELYDVSTDFILRGKDNLVQLHPDNGFVPFINVEAVAGDLNDLHSSGAASDWSWYRIPGFDSTTNTLLFEVDGDSMTPTLYQNDVIFCEAVTSLEDLTPNSIVLIGTDDGFVVKRFHKQDNYCILECDNKNYNSLRLHKDDIKAMMAVKGRITRKIETNLEVQSSKLDEMETNIKSLQSKVDLISQKFC